VLRRIEPKHMTEPTSRTSRSGALATVIGGLVLVVCCAGPALIAGGALSAIGATLGNPFVIAAGLGLIGAAAAFVFHRRSRAPQQNTALSTTPDEQPPVARDVTP